MTKDEALKIPKQLKYWAERHGIKQQRDIKLSLIHISEPTRPY